MVLLILGVSVLDVAPTCSVMTVFQNISLFDTSSISRYTISVWKHYEEWEVLTVAQLMQNNFNKLQHLH